MVNTDAGFPAFAVACGEEASDPLVFHEGGEVRVDELAASGHLDRQDEDLVASSYAILAASFPPQ